MPRREPPGRSESASARPARRAALCLALAFVALSASACGRKAITSVPTEPDAIEILDVLGQAGLEAEKRETGEGETRRWEIVVNEGWFGGGEAEIGRASCRERV